MMYFESYQNFPHNLKVSLLVNKESTKTFKELSLLVCYSRSMSNFQQHSVNIIESVTFAYDKLINFLGSILNNESH